jgi:organic hydroperoxide reductase OsmC/OhrA
MSHTYTADLLWSRGDATADADFLAQRYTRRHLLRFDGGAEVVASSSPQVVKQPWSDASGVDPEEMFVASLASCHMLWFLSLAAQAGYAVTRYHDLADGVMSKNADGKLAMTLVTLRPEVAFGAGGKRPTRDELIALHHRAHEECFIANSVRTEVRCDPRHAPA